MKISTETTQEIEILIGEFNANLDEIAQKKIEVETYKKLKSELEKNSATLTLMQQEITHHCSSLDIIQTNLDTLQNVLSNTSKFKFLDRKAIKKELQDMLSAQKWVFGQVAKINTQKQSLEKENNYIKQSLKELKTPSEITQNLVSLVNKHNEISEKLNSVLSLSIKSLDFNLNLNSIEKIELENTSVCETMA